MAALEGRLEELEYRTAEEALSAFIAACVIASRAGPQAESRLLEAEASAAWKRIVDAKENPEIVEEIIARAGARIERASRRLPWRPGRRGIEYVLLSWRVRVDEFLRIAARHVERMPGLSLASQFLEGGYVYLNVERLRTLGAAAARSLISARIEEARQIEVESPEIDGVVGEVKRVARGLLPFRREALPSCIKELSSRAAEDLEDIGAYALIAFLTNVAAGREDLEKLLENPAGEAAAKTIADILLSGELGRYKPPPCKALREQNVCKCKGSLLEAYREALRESREPS